MDLIHSISSCLQVVNEQIPLVLVYYSHVPVIVLSAFFAVYVLLKNRRDILSNYFFALNFVFILWVINDLITWVLLYDGALTMFAWSTMELLEVSFFFMSFNFAYIFLFRRKVPTLMNAFALIPVLVAFLFTVSGSVLHDYNLIVCEATENKTVVNELILAIDLVYLVGILALFIYNTAISKGAEWKRKAILTSGLFFFLLFFLIVNYLSTFTDDYNWSLIALGGMPAFLAVMSFAAVRYGLFNFKILGAQVLVFVSVFLVAAQFIFIRNPINIFLNAGTTVMLVIGGFFLIRSVKLIEAQRLELEASNKQQVILIHFITHQIKGFVAKSRNIFSLLLDGDYGQLPDTMRPLIEEGFRSDTKGANTIQEILSAANIKSGKVTYSKAEFDVKALTEEIAGDLRPLAETKGLTLELSLGTEPLMIHGDRIQLLQALKNLIDNSIKYTPKGTVAVALTKADKLVRFTVKDTGVGITKEDMAKLFTEGGHGTNSQKINVDSTGFGLYIVKNIIEAHGGRVWAESEGEGKGSTFIIELPV